MEKKRKRASFSSDMPSSIKINGTLVDEPEPPEPIKKESSLKQVVEVLVEEPASHETHKTTHVNVVIPSFGGEPQVTTHTDSNPVEPEIEEASVVEPEPPEVPRQKVEIVPDEPEPVAEKQPLPEPRITFGTLDPKAKKQSDDERQKETVAELFGNSDTVMPEITVHKGSNAKSVLLWAITMIAIALGIGGGIILFAGRNNKPQQPIPNSMTDTTPPIVPTAIPEPSAIPTVPPVVKTNLKVSVLNGGGKVGAGSKMKALLESKGYKVTNVANAPSYTYDDTEIISKASSAGILSTMKDDISGSYTVGKVETTLPDSSAFDVQVIVGK